MNAVTAALLQRAADDKATLRLTGIPEIPFGQHTRGAIEKLLKALINERGTQHPFTHDLDLLTLKLANLGEILPPLPVVLGNVSDYAMDLRYDSSEALPPPLDRKLCLQTVELLRVHVFERIRALGSPLPPP